MSGYLVYFPKIKDTEGADAMRAHGLGELLHDGHPDFRSVLENGPDGGAGVVGAIGEIKCGVFDGQSWEERQGYWLGSNGRVTPDAILRPVQQIGLPVRLEDGQKWTIPIARQMPTRFSLNGKGEPQRVLKDRYKPYYDETVRLFMELRRSEIESDVPRISVKEWWAYGLQALQWNYRITSDVADWLELFSDDAVLLILRAACEMDLIDQTIAQKKSTDRHLAAVG